MLVEIEKSYLKDKEERNKVKSLGGRRLNIEETDGSDNDEEAEERKLIGSEEFSPIAESEPVQIKMKEIKIADVESDDDDYKDAIEENKVLPILDVHKKDKDVSIKQPEEQKVNHEEESNIKTIEIHRNSEKALLILYKKIINEKDKGNNLFKNGHYAEAIQSYTIVIEKLSKEINNYSGKLALFEKKQLYLLLKT